jgi:hypothetical protein
MATLVGSDGHSVGIFLNGGIYDICYRAIVT